MKVSLVTTRKDNLLLLSGLLIQLLSFRGHSTGATFDQCSYFHTFIQHARPSTMSNFIIMRLLLTAIGSNFNKLLIKRPLRLKGIQSKGYDTLRQLMIFCMALVQGELAIWNMDLVVVHLSRLWRMALWYAINLLPCEFLLLCGEMRKAFILRSNKEENANQSNKESVMY